jgi:hypothetical protein
MGIGLDGQGSISGTGTRFFLYFIASGPAEVYPARTQDSSPRGQTGRGVKLATHLHRVTEVLHPPPPKRIRRVVLTEL